MQVVEDFIEASQQAQSPEEVWSQLQDIAVREGYENLVFVRMFHSGRIDVPWRTLPSGYDEAYVRNRWNRLDPVLHLTLTASLPFTWQSIAETTKLSRAQAAFFDECKRLGVHSGYTVPIHTPDQRDIVSISVRGNESINMRRLPLLHAMIHQTWLRHNELTQRSNASLPTPLSDAERFCLSWYMRGKTYEEIAEIMHISIKTVEAHLSSTRKKLGTTNTITAVVKALQLGLISGTSGS